MSFGFFGDWLERYFHQLKFGMDNEKDLQDIEFILEKLDEYLHDLERQAVQPDAVAGDAEIESFMGVSL